MIDVKGLTKVYVEKPAVDAVSFFVREGEVVGFLGPNGAGKSTTLRMMTGFLPPTAGEVLIGGIDMRRDAVKAKRLIGYMPENGALYPEMRVSEYLHFRGALAGMGRAELKRAVPQALEECFIGEVAESVIGTLSKGYRQRTALAGTLVHRPKVIILDEPTIGMDPAQIVKIRELIKGLGRERTVLLSTHILPEAEAVSDRVMVIDHGRILAQDSPANLRSALKGRNTYLLTLKAGPKASPAAFTGVEGLLETVETRRTEAEVAFRLEGEKDRDLRETLFALCVRQGLVLLELREDTLSMEDIFLRLTTEDVASKEAVA
jgi:ABC-2 type transport system ATP-binding protein